MSCTSMDSFQKQVETMSDSQRRTAAAAGFTKINSFAAPVKSDIVLGLCAAADLYSINIKDMPEIDKITDLSKFIDEASRLDKSERFDVGLKSFFTINYSPSKDRDEIFLGVYASARIRNVDLSIVKDDTISDVTVGPVVGPIKSIW